MVSQYSIMCIHNIYTYICYFLFVLLHCELQGVNNASQYRENSAYFIVVFDKSENIFCLCTIFGFTISVQAFLSCILYMQGHYRECP